MPRPLFRQQSEHPAPTIDPADLVRSGGRTQPNNGLRPSRSNSAISVVRRGQAIDAGRLDVEREERGLTSNRSVVLARSGNDSEGYDGEESEVERMDDPEGGLAGDAAPGKISWGPVMIAALAIGGALMLMRNR